MSQQTEPHEHETVPEFNFDQEFAKTIHRNSVKFLVINDGKFDKTQALKWSLELPETQGETPVEKILNLRAGIGEAYVHKLMTDNSGRYPAEQIIAHIMPWDHAVEQVIDELAAA